MDTRSCFVPFSARHLIGAGEINTLLSELRCLSTRCTDEDPNSHSKPAQLCSRGGFVRTQCSHSPGHPRDPPYRHLSRTLSQRFRNETSRVTQGERLEGNFSKSVSRPRNSRSSSKPSRHGAPVKRLDNSCGQMSGFGPKDVILGACIRGFQTPPPWVVR